jgi:hypothetical protein
MSGYRKTGKTCGKSERERNSRLKLPYNARGIDKVQYFNDTFINALKYHFFAHDLAVPYPVARKVLYDVWLDALKNSNDKIHKKSIESEYQNYIDYFNIKLTQYHDYVKEWEAFKKTDLYQETIQTLSEIQRTDHRLSIATDYALAYIYSKYQQRYDYTKLIQSVESALHLDIIPKVWSKTSFWIAVQLLVFDADKLYANTIGNNQVYISQYDPITGDAIKVYITPWYERNEYISNDFFKGMAAFYHDVIIPFMGEVGSVGLAEAARRGTVISLLHLSRAVLSLAMWHPALRGVQTLSKLFEFASVFLDKSILAWTGWQISIEWSLDGSIQYYLAAFARYLYEQITGIPIKKGDFTYQELRELHEAIDLYLKLLNGSGYIDGSDVKLANWYNNASLKLKQMFDKIIQVINIKERIYSLLKEAKLKKSEKEEILSKTFNYLCIRDANSFVKMLNELTSLYFEKFENALEAFSLIDTSQEYSKMMYSYYNEGKKFLVDKNYSSLYDSIENKELINDGICKKFVIVTKPARPIPPWGEVPACKTSTVIRAGISSEVIPYDLYVYTIGFQFDFTNVYDQELFSADAISLTFGIQMFITSRGSNATDLYKLMTDCSDFNNVSSALKAISPYIYIDTKTEDYKEITKYRYTDKLKLRKTKHCVSVINKFFSKRSKENLKDYFPDSLSYHRSYRIKNQYGILVYRSVKDKEDVKIIKSMFESGLSNSLEINYYSISMYEAIIDPTTSFLLIGDRCDNNDNEIAEIFRLSLGLNVPQIINQFSKDFHIIYNQDKTKVDRNKSKRSKIVCFKS